jgi:hypothetical protein
MPQLVWNETEFTACLEVLPTIDDYEMGYHYLVEKDGLKLELGVFPFTSDVYFKLLGVSGTKYVRDSRGEFLVFAPSQVFGDRFHSDFVIPVGVKLSVKPSISISMFAK